MLRVRDDGRLVLVGGACYVRGQMEAEAMQGAQEYMQEFAIYQSISEPACEEHHCRMYQPRKILDKDSHVIRAKGKVIIDSGPMALVKGQLIDLGVKVEGVNFTNSEIISPNLGRPPLPFPSWPSKKEVA